MLLYLIRFLMLAVFLLSWAGVIRRLWPSGQPLFGTIVTLPDGSLGVAVASPPSIRETILAVARPLVALGVIWLVLSWAGNSWRGALGLLITAALLAWAARYEWKQGT